MVALLHSHNRIVQNLRMVERQRRQGRDREPARIGGIVAAFDGSLPGVRAGLEKAGQRGADGIREYIDAGIDPPNAPVTLSGGWIRNRVSGKGVPVKGKSGTTPLVDTGQLYGEFGYEITER